MFYQTGNIQMANFKSLKFWIYFIVRGDRFNNMLMERLQALQNKAAKVILDRPLYSSASDALQTVGSLYQNVDTFIDRAWFSKVLMLL